MKPLNLDNRPCSPVSSNCVVWQGPTISCINICNGDTVSDVVAALATELCTVLDQTNVTNYDLTCLGITSCGPKDFQALIQFLIDQICSLQNITPETGGTRSTCPDCVITVAPCFVQNGQTTMQLIEYVQMIANKICTLIDQISNLQTQINNLDIRVTTLEEAAPPAFTIPSIIVNCTLSEGVIVGGNSYTIDLVLNALINNEIYGYCELLGATGLPAELSSAAQSACITATTPTLSNPPVPFGTEYLGSWINSPTSAADAITNLWIVLCDMFKYLTVQGSTTVVAGEGISVTSNTVGTETTYTITNDYLESFVANVSINSNFAPGSGVIPNVVPSSVNGVQEGQVIFRYTSVASNGQMVIAGAATFVPNASLPPISFGSFDNNTGLFTITDPGMYLIEAHIHLKPDSGSTEFWSGTGTTVGDIGSFLIGIHPNNNTDTYVANGQALIPSVDRNVEISTSKVITATNPTTLRVKVLNTTNRDYNGTAYVGADGISFSITKLRSGLTTTQL